MSKKLYHNTSLYIPKEEAHFLKICRVFIKEVFEDMSFSGFVLMCIKDYLNNMSLANRRKFEDCAYALSQKERPKIAAFVDKFIQKET